MPVFACPSCGGDVSFRSSLSVTATCTWCRSLLLRHDVDVEKIGVEGALLPDVSLLQIGARGRYQRVAFDVVGRTVMSWDDGRWNEWYVCLEDGRDGWLTEAQGEFAMLFADRDTDAPSKSSMQLGQIVTLASGRKYKVADTRDTVCIGIEGELPFKSTSGSRSFCVDLIGTFNNNGRASIEFSDKQARIYAGHGVRFDELQLDGLRTLDGW